LSEITRPLDRYCLARRKNNKRKILSEKEVFAVIFYEENQIKFIGRTVSEYRIVSVFIVPISDPGKRRKSVAVITAFIT
jgi:hypothetical protein